MGFISRWLPGKRERKNAPGVGSSLILSETEFHTALHLEYCRTQRCKRPFLFMRAAPAAKQDNEAFLVEFGSQLAASSREADIFGWERQGRTLGAAFIELGQGEKPGADGKSVAADFIRRRAIAILKKLPGGDSQTLILSFQFFAGTTDFSS